MRAEVDVLRVSAEFDAASNTQLETFITACLTTPLPQAIAAH
jgi:hypothetical protein